MVKGQEIEAVGEHFFEGCNDVDDDRACSRNRPGTEPSSKDVVLALTQGDRRWELGRRDADRDRRVQWRVTLPPDAVAGLAEARL